jgi:type I restriction enzyme S subunit
MDAIIDYRGKTPKKTVAGVPLVTAKIVKSGRIEPPTEYIAEDDYDAWMRRGIPEVGDVLVTTEAPLGEVAQITDARIALAQRLIALRGRLDMLDNDYLKYLMQSEPIQSQLAARASGSTVKGIKQSELRKVMLRFPPLDEQRRIAHILGTLDDKIELNRRMNATLEGIARALFQSWFVDFDPVRAKANGEPEDAICNRLGLTPDILALFPDTFQDSELGEIPAGWEVKPLDKIATYLNGLALQKYPAEEDAEYLPVIKIAQLRAGHTVNANRASLDVPAQHVIEDGDVLFSWSGSLEVEIWCGGRGALNQHLFKVSSDKYPKWFYYFWTRHHLPAFRGIAANKATTMGHIQRKHLTEALACVPSKDLLNQASMKMSPIVEKIIACNTESKSLAATRDTLLPRLLSGELCAEQEEQLAEAST